jgi:hypothetical protein
MARDHDNDGISVKGLSLWLPIMIVAAGIIGTGYVAKYRLEANERLEEREHAEFRAGIKELQAAHNEMMKQILIKNKYDK